MTRRIVITLVSLILRRQQSRSVACQPIIPTCSRSSSCVLDYQGAFMPQKGHLIDVRSAEEHATGFIPEPI
jgi:hypothetical protein